MAETHSIDPFGIDFSADAPRKQSGFRRLSLLNGLLIGLAFGLGAWGPEMLRVARLPVASYLPTLLLGMGLVIALCGFVGWLTGRIAHTLFTAVLWAATAVMCMLILGYLPFYGRTFTIWLLDSRFWGRDIFPYTLGGRPAGMILGGLLIILTLTVLGLMQNYRLENINSERSGRGRLTSRGWLALLLPLPLVFLASMITQGVLSNPASTAIAVVNQAISVAKEYDGDLRLLELGDGISYGALAPVQDQLAGDFTLSLVDSNPLTSTVVVGADFAGGGWVYCRVVYDQLLFCSDAAPPYTTGLRSALTGEPLPEDCRGCELGTDETTAAWLMEHRGRWGAAPAIERVAQQGSHVLMRAVGDDIAAECWIEGLTPTRLTSCQEVR